MVQTVKIGINGTNGQDGADGFSPVATVTQTQSGATISITDKNGTTTANITNGQDGAALNNILDGSETGSVRTSGTQTNIAQYAFAEGYNSKASGQYSHAEGNGSITNALYSHAEGYATTTILGANASHAEGQDSKTYGIGSHAEGIGTIAKYDGQHAEGQYNEEDTGGTGFRGQYVHITGIGTTSRNRKNGHTIDWSGNGWFAGTVSAGTAQTPASVTNDNDLTTKYYVDNIVGNIETLLSGI